MTAASRQAAAGTSSASGATAAGAADWLCLAAAPSFAMMALLTAVPGGSAPDLLCSAMHRASLLGGMLPMYLLMSLFHLPPWLRLVFRRRINSA